MRDALGDVSEGSLVLVALSGGADSLALAAAAAHEGRAARLRVGAVVVDHGLQRGSAEVAERAADQARGLGLDPVLVRRVEVALHGGPEGAARESRYLALAEAAAETGAAALLLAHTRDDQAEQVLLALARGSGTRSLAGIPPERPVAGALVLRPFLDERAGVTRSTTEAACAELGLEPWHDPHNADRAFARVRARERALPVLEAELGPGIAAALARTADLAREDADALDALAAELVASAVLAAGDPAMRSAAERVEVPVAPLAAAHAAIRHRAIRRIASAHFGAHLTREHTIAIAALVVDWRGQGPIHAPGITVSRAGAALVFQGP